MLPTYSENFLCTSPTDSPFPIHALKLRHDGEAARCSNAARIASEQYLELQFLPHKKHRVSFTKTNRLMFREVIAFNSGNHKKYINVGKWRVYLTLKQVVLIITTVLRTVARGSVVG